MLKIVLVYLQEKVWLALISLYLHAKLLLEILLGTMVYSLVLGDMDLRVKLQCNPLVLFRECWCFLRDAMCCKPDTGTWDQILTGW